MSDFTRGTRHMGRLARIVRYAPLGLARGREQHSWLVEIPILLGVIIALAFVLKPRIDLLHAAPHPFWIPVVAAALVHGIVPGVFATLLAGLCNWFFAGALITTEDDYYDVMFKTFKEPVLWLFAVLVLGTLRERVEEERRTLARQRDEAREDLGRVVDHAAELRDRIQDLERVIALSAPGPDQRVVGDRDSAAISSRLAHSGSGESRVRTNAAGEEAGDAIDIRDAARPATGGDVPGTSAPHLRSDALLPGPHSLVVANDDDRDPVAPAARSARRSSPFRSSSPAADQPALSSELLSEDPLVPLSRRFGLFIRKAPLRARGGPGEGLLPTGADQTDGAAASKASYMWQWVSLWKLEGNAWTRTAGDGAVHFPDPGRLLRRMDEEPRIYDSRKAKDREVLPEDTLLACPLRVGLGPASKVIMIGGGHIGEAACLHDLVTDLFETAVRLERTAPDRAVP
jgi:hypothetical protein